MFLVVICNHDELDELPDYLVELALQSRTCPTIHTDTSMCSQTLACTQEHPGVMECLLWLSQWVGEVGFGWQNFSLPEANCL